MTPVEILKAARKLITVPERWTQGSLARTETGTPIGPLEQNAVCWCVEGALRHAAGTNSPHSYKKAGHLLDMVTGGYPAPFNDAPGRTHAEVLDLFDRAIAAAEAQ